MVRRLSSSRKWPLSLRAIRERLARDHIHTLVAHEDVVDGLDKGLIVEQLRIVGEVWLSSVSVVSVNAVSKSGLSLVPVMVSVVVAVALYPPLLSFAL